MIVEVVVTLLVVVVRIVVVVKGVVVREAVIVGVYVTVTGVPTTRLKSRSYAMGSAWPLFDMIMTLHAPDHMSSLAIGQVESWLVSSGWRGVSRSH